MLGKFLRILLLVILAAGCSTTTYIFHPGLGNTGARVAARGQFEIGYQSFWFLPLFMRAQYGLTERLSFSAGVGLTGVWAGGIQAILNWQMVDNRSFYLTLSPHVVTHINNERNVRGISAAVGLTPGLRLCREVNFYFPVIAARYRDNMTFQVDYYGVAGVGIDLDLNWIRFTVEYNAPFSEVVGQTQIAHYFGAGLYFKW